MASEISAIKPILMVTLLPGPTTYQLVPIYDAREATNPTYTKSVTGAVRDISATELTGTLQSFLDNLVQAARTAEGA